jgi:predicted DNA-binding ribbon-helix-helix protein
VDGAVKKRSVMIEGHATSVSLEPAFWDALSEIARARRLAVNQLIAEIDRGRSGNLSSAIRVFVLRDTQAGRAGHG